MHKALESKQDFSTWIKNRIEKLKLVQGRDFLLHKLMEQVNKGVSAGGHNKIDYIVTIDIAKHLAMIEMTDKGHQVREYFIECEKKLNQKMLPQTYKQALIELLQVVEENERLALENQTKQERIELLSHTGKGYTMTEIAKELNMKSANELNKRLAEMKVQYKSNGTWVMYSKYSKKGYEHIKQEVTDNGAVIYHRKITQAGREFILNLFKGAENE